jgi:thiamine biosynthesis lipoprotein
VERRTFESLGGLCELYAIGAGGARLEQAQVWTQRLHDRLTRFEPHSEVSRLNVSRGRWFAVSPELEALLRQSLRAFEVSAGLVNVAVLPALMAAGYTRDLAAGPTPASSAPRVAALPDVLELRPGEARLRFGSSVDLGGIAKGWIADRLANELGDNVLVNLCGDLYARGGGETGEGWPVGFGDRTLLLKDMGCATSGTTKRAWAGGHHLIDPRTGRPAQTDLSEVSVLATTATDAEIFAKVALLKGAVEGASWLDGRALGWSLSPTSD